TGWPVDSGVSMRRVAQTGAADYSDRNGRPRWPPDCQTTRPHMPERSDVPTDIAKLSFEDALKELEEIVRALESGKGKLDEAIKSYERGVALKRHCERKLA